MDANALSTVLLGALQEANELIVAAVDTTIGQQTNEVHSVVCEGVLDVLPAVARERVPVLQSDVDQPGALIDDLAGAPAESQRPSLSAL